MPLEPECDLPVQRIPGTRNFSFFGGIGIGRIWYRKKSLGTDTGKIWYWIKVSKLVSVKIAFRKKSWNRYRKRVSERVSKKFGTEKSPCIGIGNI